MVSCDWTMIQPAVRKTHELRLALQIPNGIGCFIFLESLMVEIEFNLANGVAAEGHGAEGGALAMKLILIQ